MVQLVETEVVKARLNIDFDTSDEDLELLIQGASEMVLNYLNLPHDHYDDSSGAVQDVPVAVVTATCYLTGVLYRDRDGKEVEQWERGYLPAPVISMLYPLRDPALA